MAYLNTRNNKYKLGFNSFDVDKKYREPCSTEIQTNSKNQYEIQFVVNVSNYWDGVCVVFPSKSAAFFSFAADPTSTRIFSSSIPF